MYQVDVKYEGANCKICTQQNEVLLVGKIHSILSDDIMIDTDSSTLMLHMADKHIKVQINHGEFENVMLKGEVEVVDTKLVRIKNIDLLSDRDQRQYERVYYNRVETLHVNGGAGGMISMKFRSRVIDVSLGGALLESGLALPINRDAVLEIKHDEGESLSLKGKIVRQVNSPNDNRRYGFKFNEVGGDDVQALGALLFKVQQENENRNHGL